MMNAKNPKESIDTRHAYRLLSEIEQEQEVSQRELATRLGIAVGLVNSYIKNLVGKGYVRIKAFPRNRYAYLLTPKGIAEKSRLAASHLSYLTNLYRDARRDYRALFLNMAKSGDLRVIFCGSDEVAEIAYLSLIEVGGIFEHIVDCDPIESMLMGKPVEPLVSIVDKSLPVVVTSVKRGQSLFIQLSVIGVHPGRIYLPSMLHSLLDNATEVR